MSAPSITRSDAVDSVVVLREGSRVRVRPLTGADRPLLADGFARLSLESRYFRFLTGKPGLSAAELDYFTVIDHHDHEALVAVSTRDGRGVGVARYIRSVADSELADVAVTVVDEWHRRGVGAALMTRLIDRAIAEGVRRFSACVATDNVAVLGLLDRLGLEHVLVDVADGVLEYEIILDRPQSDAA